MNIYEKIYTVSELNTLAKKLLEDDFSDILLEGEISNFVHHSSGHMYFTVKDEGASLSAVMFKGYNLKLDFNPQNGQKALVQGSLSVFVKGGKYQIIVSRMVEKGEGELEKRFLQLKEKLKNQGLFDAGYKKPIPAVPTLIGIVTSPEGAAIRDILNILNRRFANIDIILYPAKVQGSLAAGEIVKGIEILNKHYPDMDVLILSRGGGSLEDLWPFNEETVARAIFDSVIPVISAVGHEVDWTISDFVADLRAPTPSAAAELVTKSKEELIKQLEKINLVMSNALHSCLSLAESRLKGVAGMPSFKYPLRQIEQKDQEIDYITLNMRTKIKHYMEIKEHKLTGVFKSVLFLSPENTLMRGYSITYLKEDGSVVKDSINIKKGSLLKTIFSRGSAESEVKELGTVPNSVLSNVKT